MNKTSKRNSWKLTCTRDSSATIIMPNDMPLTSQTALKMQPLKKNKHAMKELPYKTLWDDLPAGMRVCVSVSPPQFCKQLFLFNEHVAVYHPSLNSDWQRSQRKNTSWQTHQTKNADPNSVPANSSWKANSWARFLQLWPSSLRLLRVETNSLNCTSH